MASPSKGHKNKLPHNWLVYKISDYFLKKNKHLITGTVVDLGCGDAPFKSFFLQFANRYIGVDWAESLHHIKADVISDLNKSISLENEIADTVISLSVIEHLAEPQIFLEEAHRILKTGGNLILQAPWQWHIHEEPFDYFRYSPYGLKNMLKKAGFKDIEIEPQAGVFTTLSVKLNYFLVRSIYKRNMFIKYSFALLFLPIWTLTQILAIFLDKLDDNWESDTIGFMVTAKK